MPVLEIPARPGALHAFGYELRFGHAFSTARRSRATGVPFPGQAAIGGHVYNVELDQLQFGSVDALRAARDTGAAPGENSLNPEGAWKRNAADWTLGSGQEYSDDDGAYGFQSLGRRFFTSKGVDCWTRRTLKLHHDVRTLSASVRSFPALQVLAAGTHLYVADGTTVKFSDDPLDGSPTWTTLSALPAAATSNIATDGNTLWLADGTGVRKVAVGASGATAYIGNGGSTFAADALAYVAGWLIGSKGARVVEIAADGTIAAATQLDYTHPNPGWKWLPAVSAPNAIYLAGSCNGYGAIYAVGVDSSGKLTVPIFAAELPRGEVPTALAYYGERLFVGTSRGVRLFEVLSTDALVPNALTPLAAPVRCADGQGEYVWFGWTNYDLVSTGLGRARMSEFIAENVPATATDLLAAGQGATTSVCTFASHRLFAVDGLGVFVEADVNVASGTIDFGWFTFGLFEPKSYAGVELVTAPLEGSITVAVVDEYGRVVTLGTHSVADTIGGQPLPVVDVGSEQLRVQLTLAAPNDRTLGPQVRRVTVRALPNPAVVNEYLLPIKLYESVDQGRGGVLPTQRLDVWNEYAYLKALEATGEVVTMQFGGIVEQVTVRNITLAQQNARSWNSDRMLPQGIYMVKLVSVDSG